MGIKEELKGIISEFKEDRKRKQAWKKQLDFKKYKAMEIAKARREVKDIKEGKKTEMSDADLLGYDITKVKL